MITAHRAVVGTAIEMPMHRRTSPIGSPQRHYRLNPPLMIPGGGHHRDAIVIAGSRSTYAFAGDDDGEIVDFTALATVTTGGDDSTVLCALGYSLVKAV